MDSLASVVSLAASVEADGEGEEASQFLLFFRSGALSHIV